MNFRGYVNPVSDTPGFYEAFRMISESSLECARADSHRQAPLANNRADQAICDNRKSTAQCARCKTT